LSGGSVQAAGRRSAHGTDEGRRNPGGAVHAAGGWRKRTKRVKTHRGRLMG